MPNVRFNYQGRPYVTPTGHNTTIYVPLIPVDLFRGGVKTPSLILGLLDSGCDNVLFPASTATLVGITDVTTGQRVPTIGISGQSQDVFEHALECVSRTVSFLAVPVGNC